MVFGLEFVTNFNPPFTKYFTLENVLLGNFRKLFQQNTMIFHFIRPYIRLKNVREQLRTEYKDWSHISKKKARIL